MDAVKFASAFFLLVVCSAEITAATTCLTIKKELPGSPSGKYLTSSRSGIPVEIYCEMGLNGGGYTFLPPYALTFLKNEEVLSMFTNRTSFLLRARKTDGTQPYGILTQLREYAGVPLMLGINDHTGYTAPVNENDIGEPYLYFGFLPIAVGANKSLKGLEVNGQRLTFDSCDLDPKGQMTLFTNYAEVKPTGRYNPSPVCDQIFSNLTVNPSGRVMPPEYFTFGETHWGGCGCYTQTNRIPNILSITIGFR